ncbi:MAG: GvpL/GvpF family gas vesicle protein [Chloroflexota bacterium]|nr:GvpL/GvpF family gas vesicle protein [Chloroflexota bacterium]
MTDELRYLYAVADSNAEAAIVEANLRGIDGGRVEVIVEGRLLGATSSVPAADYEEEPLNQRLQDLDWLAPRAALHQEVNGKLLELARAVIPLTFGAIYRGTDGVRDLLRSRAEDLADRLRAVEGRAEWIVSIEREGIDAPLGDAVRALDAEIAAAPPGRAFLLGKRRDEVIREERRTRDAAVAEETWAAVEAIAERVYREQLIDDPTATAIARFSVLAHRDREVELGDVVRRLSATGTSEGYRVRLSGPWPAYRFGGLPSERLTSA